MTKIEVGDCSDGSAGWDGASTPDSGATIIWRGHDNQWAILVGTFGHGWTDCAASEFVSSRPFDTTGGFFTGQQAVWNGSCFLIPETGACVEAQGTPPDPGPGHWEHRPKGDVWMHDKAKPPVISQPTATVSLPDTPVHSDPNVPPPIPPNAGPGHYEHRPKGWVWVHDAPAPSPAPPKGSPMSNNQADREAGYTQYLCPVDENGREQQCSAMTPAQTAIAVRAFLATPVGAEDRKAGHIKTIDPSGKWGPVSLVSFGAGIRVKDLTVSLLQWDAIQAAIAANPEAGVPTTVSSEQGGSASSSTSSDLETAHKHVNFGVRILEGIAAVAGVGFVVFEIWKHTKRRAA